MLFEQFEFISTKFDMKQIDIIGEKIHAIICHILIKLNLLMPDKASILIKNPYF